MIAIRIGDGRGKAGEIDKEERVTEKTAYWKTLISIFKESISETVKKRFHKRGSTNR